MGKVSLKTEEIDIDRLQKSTLTVADFLREYLLDKQSTEFKQVCEQLQDYYKDEGGSPVVSEFDIVDEDCSFDGRSKGKVRLKYVVEYHFGCSDLSPVTPITETCDFSVDADNSILSILIPDKVVRDTNDEF
jgi:hypothetical protein